jgi:hypothetical protein
MDQIGLGDGGAGVIAAVIVGKFEAIRVPDCLGFWREGRNVRFELIGWNLRARCQDQNTAAHKAEGQFVPSAGEKMTSCAVEAMSCV